MMGIHSGGKRAIIYAFPFVSRILQSPGESVENEPGNGNRCGSHVLEWLGFSPPYGQVLLFGLDPASMVF